MFVYRTVAAQTLDIATVLLATSVLGFAFSVSAIGGYKALHDYDLNVAFV